MLEEVQEERILVKSPLPPSESQQYSSLVVFSPARGPIRGGKIVIDPHQLFLSAHVVHSQVVVDEAVPSAVEEDGAEEIELDDNIIVLPC